MATSQIEKLEETIREQGVEIGSAMLLQAKSLTDLTVQMGIFGERIVGVMEKSGKVELRVTKLEGRCNDFAVAIGLNRFIPKVFFALCTALVLGASGTYFILKELPLATKHIPVLQEHKN